MSDFKIMQWFQNYAYLNLLTSLTKSYQTEQLARSRVGNQAGWYWLKRFSKRFQKQQMRYLHISSTFASHPVKNHYRQHVGLVQYRTKKKKTWNPPESPGFQTPQIGAQQPSVRIRFGKIADRVTHASPHRPQRAGCCSLGSAMITYTLGTATKTIVFCAQRAFQVICLGPLTGGFFFWFEITFRSSAAAPCHRVEFELTVSITCPIGDFERCVSAIQSAHWVLNCVTASVARAVRSEQLHNQGWNAALKPSLLIKACAEQRSAREWVRPWMPIIKMLHLCRFLSS